MSLFNEIKEVLISKEIVFKEMKQEEAGIHTFIFVPLKPLKWIAGKHAMFFITNKKIDKSMRLFSISSCPSENIIAITTKIKDNPSAYKKALMELKPETKMSLRGPMGPFVIKQDKDYCFIAAGIGITPFRSMLKELELGNQNFNGSIKLLYVNSTNKFLFGEELKALNSENISIEFLTDKQTMANSINQTVLQDKNYIYFIAGSKEMITSTKRSLIELGVKKKNIKTDTFIGY